MLRASLSFVRGALLLLAWVSLLGGCASSGRVRAEMSTLDRMRARDAVVIFPGAPAFVSWTPGPLLRVDPPTASLLGLR